VRDHESPTGIAVIQVCGEGEQQIHPAPGANERLSVDDVHAARSLLEDTRVLLVQLEVPLEVVETSVRIAHAAGALVVLDPAPPVKLSPDLLRLVYLIRSNSDEARVLTDGPVRERRTARRAATLLLESGVRAAVVQAGAEGNLMLWSEDGTTREQWLPHFQVSTVDTTGAGDAFAAALAVEIALGRPLDEAGRFASATAALTTTKFGAQPALPTRADVESFLARLGS
jgi:ribokinase